MRIGVPREIKNHEYRVGLTPSSVRQLVQLGHEVWVEAEAGSAIGFGNADFAHAGAKIVDTEQAFSAPLVVKVKRTTIRRMRTTDRRPDTVLLLTSSHSQISSKGVN